MPLLSVTSESDMMIAEDSECQQPSDDAAAATVAVTLSADSDSEAVSSSDPPLVDQPSPMSQPPDANG